MMYITRIISFFVTKLVTKRATANGFLTGTSLNNDNVLITNSDNIEKRDAYFIGSHL